MKEPESTTIKSKYFLTKHHVLFIYLFIYLFTFYKFIFIPYLLIHILLFRKYFLNNYNEIDELESI